MSDNVQSHLQEYCARAFPGWQDIHVRNVVSINTGWESDVYSFDLEYGPAAARQRQDLILRIYPGDDAQAKSAHEYKGMSILKRTGYPVPQMLVLEQNNSPFGKPFVIMERVNGQVLWPILFRSPRQKQQELLTLFCTLFVQLHALDWRPFVGDPVRYETGGPYLFVDQWLGWIRAALDRFPASDFAHVLEWLEARRDLVPCRRPSLVHWDYHPGNILLRGDGSAAVIDWTQLDVSDPRFDLAWTLLLVGSHEGAAWREPILREYERLAGVTVEHIEFFDVAACLKRLGSVVASLAVGSEKLGMRPGAEAKMRQQMGAIEKVYGLLLERTGIRLETVERVFASSG